MESVTRLKRQIRAVAKVTALTLLVCAMLAPKVSLALVTLLGSSNASVVICTGTGLTRVTIAPGGQIVEEVSEEGTWVSPQCALPDERTAALERAWQQVNYPHFVQTSLVSVVDSIHPPTLVRPGVLSRGPPPAFRV